MTLTRFLTAQSPIYPAILAELRAGQKRTHWMWFVFPQLRGLGQSERARRFGIAGLAEARLYLADPVLGARLRECVGLVLGHPDSTAHDIFGTPDDLKFRSSMTLFSRAALTLSPPNHGPDGNPFREALRVFYAGEEDPRTLAMLDA